MKPERFLREVIVTLVRYWVREYHSCEHEYQTHPAGEEGQAGADFLLALGEKTYGGHP